MISRRVHAPCTFINNEQWEVEVIGDATVTAWCDICGTKEEIQLTALARSGSYDMRNVEADLKGLYWSVDGDKTICPDCLEEAKP